MVMPGLRSTSETSNHNSPTAMASTTSEISIRESTSAVPSTASATTTTTTSTSTSFTTAPTAAPLESSPRPRPRPPNPHTTHKNRRLTYLTKTPTYLSSPDHELAAPLLYDRCIRQFQTPAEREAEGRLKGWSGILHADLERAEAKVAAVREEKEMEGNGEWSSSAAAGGGVGAGYGGVWSEWAGEAEEEVKDREEGIERWRRFVTRRFLEGGDQDVDYTAIDESEEWDDVVEMEREAAERYFDEEEPETGGTDTGIQDF